MKLATIERRVIKTRMAEPDLPHHKEEEKEIQTRSSVP